MKFPACENRKIKKREKGLERKIQIVIPRRLSMKVETDTEKLVA